MIDKSRSNNKAHYGFMSDKGSAAIDILALAVAFLCVV